MPDKKKKSDDKPDDVKREDYNKIVESHNSLKAEKEKLEKQIKEYKDKSEKEESNKLEEEKKAWEKEKEEKDKQIEELKKKAEENTKVAKGVVSKEEEEKKEVNPDSFKEQLNKQLPEPEKDPNRFASNLARYGWYKNPTTKQYTEDHIAKGLALDAELQLGAYGKKFNAPGAARPNKEDLILR